MKLQKKPLYTAVLLGATAIGANAANVAQDQAGYVPSSNIYLNVGSGNCTNGHAGCYSGDALLGDTPTSGEFQINVEYIDGNADHNAEVDWFNTHALTGLNWVDPEYYAFSFSGDDTTPIYEYEGDVIGNADWAITGWYHSPFYGTWTDNGDSGLSDGDYLSLDSGYHSWGADGAKRNLPGTATPLWVFANVDSEVLGYTYRSVGDDTWLEPDIADNSTGGGGGGGNDGDVAGCAYSPNGSIDTLLMLLLACGIFYGRNAFARN